MGLPLLNNSGQLQLRVSYEQPAKTASVQVFVQAFVAGDWYSNETKIVELGFHFIRPKTKVALVLASHSNMVIQHKKHFWMLLHRHIIPWQ